MLARLKASFVGIVAAAVLVMVVAVVVVSGVDTEATTVSGSLSKRG